ncbi:MAG: hypothetical protein AAGH99_07955 [Planctomycetota bacterium]
MLNGDHDDNSFISCQDVLVALMSDNFMLELIERDYLHEHEIDDLLLPFAYFKKYVPGGGVILYEPPLNNPNLFEIRLVINRGKDGVSANQIHQINALLARC